MPALSQLWCWIQHSCLHKWDILITFTKERFLRNIEIEVNRKFSNEYEIYLRDSINASLAALGCVELLTDDDEFEIAKRIGGSNPQISLAIDTLRDSVFAVDRICTPSEYEKLSQCLDRENHYRSSLDRLLFDQIELPLT